jgi:eukaryotic-like serine/threonine-protein kinase
MAVKGDLATLVTERVGIFALQEAEVGAVDKAKKWADDLPAEIQNRDIRLLQAMLFARTGEVEKAQRLSDTISQEFPQDTMVQNYYLPVIRAAIRLKQKDPAGAIEILRDTMKYELGGASLYNSIYPAYLRGLAYLQMGNGALAAPEFQKLLDHPGVVGRFVTGALAQQQLARAQAMAGDKVAARHSYEKFLGRWKDADADIPIYRQAKAEYSHLD